MGSALDDMTVFREYEPRELGADGYPLVWHDLGRGEPLVWTADGRNIECWDDGAREPYGVKHLVRAVAGKRCQRCGHPYRFAGTWETLAGETVVAQPRLTDEQLFDAALVIESGARIHWSFCDEHCTHGGPVRVRDISGQWQHYGPGDDAGPLLVMSVERQAAWRILTVHHLNERKHDLRWWNLAALCQRCHLTIQRRVTMEVSYPWEHTPWFRPHAAAWYALRYLGEHLTHTETIARLDELLEVGRREELVERMAL